MHWAIRNALKSLGVEFHRCGTCHFMDNRWTCRVCIRYTYAHDPMDYIYWEPPNPDDLPDYGLDPMLN